MVVGRQGIRKTEVVHHDERSAIHQAPRFVGTVRVEAPCASPEQRPNLDDVNGRILFDGLDKAMRCDAPMGSTEPVADL